MTIFHCYVSSPEGMFRVCSFFYPCSNVFGQTTKQMDTKLSNTFWQTSQAMENPCGISDSLVHQVIFSLLGQISSNFSGQATGGVAPPHPPQTTSCQVSLSSHERGHHWSLLGSAPWPSEKGVRNAWTANIKQSLVGGWPTPLKNMKVSWDYYSQYMEKHVANHQPVKQSICPIALIGELHCQLTRQKPPSWSVSHHTHKTLPCSPVAFEHEVFGLNILKAGAKPKIYGQNPSGKKLQWMNHWLRMMGQHL